MAERCSINAVLRFIRGVWGVPSMFLSPLCFWRSRAGRFVAKWFGINDEQWSFFLLSWLLWNGSVRGFLVLLQFWKFSRTFSHKQAFRFFHLRWSRFGVLPFTRNRSQSNGSGFGRALFNWYRLVMRPAIYGLTRGVRGVPPIFMSPLCFRRTRAGRFVVKW